MILLAFFLPVAIYLLVLGGINRRRYPLMVSGVWDFIGILFAASGFLLVGGPAILSILSSGSERSRLFWLLGKAGSGQSSDGGWQAWVFLSVIYFAGVVAGAGWVLWRQRHLTSIYNADPGLVERCLDKIFARLGIQPVRSGSLYLFGLAGEPSHPQRGPGHEGIQAPHYLPGPSPVRTDAGPQVAVTGSDANTTGADFLGQTAILELETFASLRHVTLRWDPVDSLFRQEIESQLARSLAEMPAEESEVGSWLMAISLGLLALLFLGGLLVLLLRWPR